VSCAETAELIDLLFGLWSRVGWKKHKFNCIRKVAPICTISIVFARWRQCANMWRHIGTTWQIQLNRPSAAAMQSYVKLLWPLVHLTANFSYFAFIGTISRALEKHD